MAAGRAVHATLKLASATAPPATVTVRGLSPATVQLAAIPASPTTCSPTLSAVTETLPLTSMARPASLSTVTLYPSGSGSTPLVATLMARSPVPGVIRVHTTTIVSAVVSPTTTWSDRGLSPWTAQLPAMPVSPISWLPGVTSGRVTVAAVPIACAAPPSSVSV